MTEYKYLQIGKQKMSETKIKTLHVPYGLQSIGLPRYSDMNIIQTQVKEYIKDNNLISGDIIKLNEGLKRVLYVFVDHKATIHKNDFMILIERLIKDDNLL